LCITPKVKAAKVKKKLNYIKIKNFYEANGTISTITWSTNEWQETLANHIYMIRD
jgi:hypothetical protein